MQKTSVSYEENIFENIQSGERGITRSFINGSREQSENKGSENVVFLTIEI